MASSLSSRGSMASKLERGGHWAGCGRGSRAWQREIGRSNEQRSALVLFLDQVEKVNHVVETVLTVNGQFSQ